MEWKAPKYTAIIYPVDIVINGMDIYIKALLASDCIKIPVAILSPTNIQFTYNTISYTMSICSGIHIWICESQYNDKTMHKLR
jgi:hypothetical protein